MRNAWDPLRSGGHSTIVVRISTLVWVIDYFMTAGHTHASPSDDAQQEVVAVALADWLWLAAATTPRLDH